MTAPNNKEAKEQAQLTEEISEWRRKLSEAKSVNAQRKVLGDIVRNMSTGRDVSPLFADVVKLLQVRDYRVKKLVYIYLGSNAGQAGGGRALLCVNALEQASQDADSAVVRAGALRAMGAAASSDTAEYFATAAARGLADQDPFVRRCACACAARLFRAARDKSTAATLLPQLRDRLSDTNQSVVAAAAAALIAVLAELSSDEIQTFLDRNTHLIFNQVEVSQLLTVLSQCTEWSALTILQAISQYGEIPQADELESSLQRLTPFLKHGNPSVALNTVNVILRYCRSGSVEPGRVLELEAEALQSVLALASQGESPEVQWIALRALRLVAGTLQHREALKACERNVRLLFPRYNDELYVKIEKLEALAMVCTDASVHEVIDELADACKDVSQQFVKTALRTMARVACRAPEAASHVVRRYLELLGASEASKGFSLPYFAAQELISSIQDVFRTFPGQYESVITQLCEAVGELDDPGARGSLIWLLGENCMRIESTEEILAELLGVDLEEGETTELPGFSEEPVSVQLEVVTALAKLLCAVPSDAGKTLHDALKKSIKSVTSPDVKMRFNYYEKLMRLDPDVAKQVIFVQKPAPLFSDGLSQKLSFQLSQRLGSVQATLRELIQLNARVNDDTDELIQQFDEVVIDVQELQRMQQEVALSAKEAERQKEMEIKASQILGETAEVHSAAPAAAAAQTAVPADDIFAELFTAAPAAGTGGQSAPAFVPPQAAAQGASQAAGSSVAASAAFNPLDFVRPVSESVEAAPIESKAPADPSSNPLDDIFGDIGGNAQASVAPVQQPAPVNQAPLSTGFSISVDSPGAFDASQCFTDAYSFAKATEAPLRMKDSQCPIKLTVAWTRFGGSAGLLLQARNESSTPLLNPFINIKPNTFGLYALKTELPPIPALGLMNSGNWFLVPLGVNSEVPNFPPAKLSALDDACESGFNVITFEVTPADRSASYFYQSKMPVFCAFTETSLWHDVNRGLTDQMSANQALQQSWPQWGESSAQIQLTYDQLGGGSYQDSLNLALGRLHKGNFNYITIGQECSDYTMNLQVNVGQQARNVLLFTRVWYKDNAGAVQFNISVRSQSTHLLLASYACQSAVQLISSK